MVIFLNRSTGCQGSSIIKKVIDLSIKNIFEYGATYESYE